MRLEEVFGEDVPTILARDVSLLDERLREFHPEDVADMLEPLDAEQAVTIVRALEPSFAASVIEALELEPRHAILEKMQASRAAGLLSELPPDDRIDVVQDLPESLSAMLLSALEKSDAEAAQEVRELGVYAEDTAGGIMTLDFVALPPDVTVEMAIEAVREASAEDEIETVFYLYVLYGETLVGVVSLRELLLANPRRTLEEIMTSKVVRLSPYDDQEEVAQVMARYNFSALPVVNDDGHMLGLVTVDDVVDVVIEEATEDAQMMGGTLPLEEGYFETGFWTFLRKRVTWLLILFVGQLLTATVMEQHDVAAIAGLVVFIPLIIATGGNSGAQSSTLIIRSLAVGEVEPKDWHRIFARELAMGLALGLLLGAVGFARAHFVGGDASIELAWTVSISIMAVVTLGTLSGSLLPLAIERLGFDPAVSSTPFIASLVDVVGLILYFVIAGVIFGIAL